MDHFLDLFVGKHTISTQGVVGAANNYSGWVGGGCNCKHHWLMERLLDRANYFDRFFDRFFFALGRGVSLIFWSCESETAT